MFKFRYVINLAAINIHNSLMCTVYNWNIILVYGNSAFTAMMNNTQTLDGRIVKAVCGVPANILFVVFVLIMYFVKNSLKKKKMKKEIAEDSQSV